MVRFDDYHRTIVGYHGTRLSVALEIVKRSQPFKFSQNDDDWLGHGIYLGVRPATGLLVGQETEREARVGRADCYPRVDDPTGLLPGLVGSVKCVVLGKDRDPLSRDNGRGRCQGSRKCQ